MSLFLHETPRKRNWSMKAIPESQTYLKAFPTHQLFLRGIRNGCSRGKGWLACSSRSPPAESTQFLWWLCHHNIFPPAPTENSVQSPTPALQRLDQLGLVPFCTLNGWTAFKGSCSAIPSSSHWMHFSTPCSMSPSIWGKLHLWECLFLSITYKVTLR